jgi:hypothetical protein
VKVRRAVWLLGAVCAVALAAVIGRAVLGTPTDVASDACSDLLQAGGSSVEVSMGAVARAADVTFGVDGSLGADGSIRLFPSTDDNLPPTRTPIALHVGERAEINGRTVCVAASHANRLNVSPGGGGSLSLVVR